MSGSGSSLARSAWNSLNGLLAVAGLRLVRLPALQPVEHHGRRYEYEMISLPRYAPWLGDEPFQEVARRIAGHTLVDRFRCWELYQLVREVRNVPGDIVEVGVWRGGTGAILASAAARWKPASRVYLCDTFAGVVKASAHDSAYTGGEHSDTSIELVRGLVDRLELRNVELLPGIFPDETAGRVRSGTIALAHVDVDVYQSALDVVAWVRERMPAGGILVFDDYGFRGCDGVTRLVHELRESDDWLYLYNLNGHAILVRRDTGGAAR
jgi:O-methyltransferase